MANNADLPPGQPELQGPFEDGADGDDLVPPQKGLLETDPMAPALRAHFAEFVRFPDNDSCVHRTAVQGCC
jgi:hypothetical protein